MNDKNYGVIKAEDGDFEVLDFLQTDTILNRTWTIALLSDDTVVFKIESLNDENQKNVVQTFRLTKESITLLQLCLTQIDQQFNINMEKIAKDMLKDKDNVMKFKKPDK